MPSPEALPAQPQVPDLSWDRKTRLQTFSPKVTPCLRPDNYTAWAQMYGSSRPVTAVAIGRTVENAEIVNRQAMVTIKTYFNLHNSPATVFLEGEDADGWSGRERVITEHVSIDYAQRLFYSHSFVPEMGFILTENVPVTPELTPQLASQAA